MTAWLTIIFALCLTLVNPVSSQQVSFIKYTVYDGLVANSIRCIYQDSKGFIWVGTYEGLSRYDGYKFTNYTNSNGLSHNLINSISEADGKLLLAENNGAIDVIQHNSIHQKYMASSAVNIVMPYNGRLLLTTDRNGFYEYKNDSIILPPQEKNTAPLGHFLPLNDSVFLCHGIDDNLFIYKKDLTILFSLKKLRKHFYSLYKDSKNRIWACTSSGLNLMEFIPGKKPTISIVQLPSEFNFPPLNNSQVTSIIEEKNGSYWIGTMKGLVHLFPGGKYHVYNEKDGLPAAIINTLYQDKESNLWVGTALGLAKWVSKNNVLFYNTENREFRNNVGSIYHLTGKKIILGIEHGLQEYNIDTREFKDIKGTGLEHPIPVQNTSPMLVHFADKIGILDSTNGIIIPFKKLDTVLNGVISGVRHTDGTIFLACFDGLIIIKKRTVKKILPHRITSLIIDHEGNVWAGSWVSGLYKISTKNGAQDEYDVKNLTSVIKENSIRSLYADSHKNIWVGTRYAGAFRLSPKANAQFEVQHFSRQSGLMSDWVSAFAETDAGDMWIGSYQGIDKLVNSSLGYRVFSFSKSVNFFAEVKKIIQVRKNEWICVANTGIAYFKDENLHRSPPYQPLILSAILGVGQNKLTILSPSEKIFLNPNQNVARFEFSALGFLNERQILYSYRLNGSVDTNWSKPENVHEASYASLSPGNYTFEVKTIGWNGEYSEPSAFAFSIGTPFWKQMWFIILCALAVFVFFYSLYQYRIRQLLQLQHVRNSIATDLHDDIGSSLTNISILSELSSTNISRPEKAQTFLQRILEEVQASNQAMDDIIWSVDSRNDSLQETMARMRRYAAELFDNSKTNCHLKFDENASYKKLSMDLRRDVYLIYKETLNNIHKHAAAKNVWIEVTQNQHHLCMQVKDDGKGFNSHLITHRNGLKNLKSRVARWKGHIEIDSEENKGTAIVLKIPLKE